MAVLAPKLGCVEGDKQYDKLRYGVYVFYINTIKTLLLILVALALGILPYVVVFALAYGSLRLYSFGVHLESTFMCTVFGMVYYLGSVYLSLYIGMTLTVVIVLTLFCAVSFALFAPAQTRKRPIPEKQRKALKRKALIVLAVVTVLVFLIYKQYPVFSSLLCLAAVCQSVNLLPITYKILKES